MKRDNVVSLTEYRSRRAPSRVAVADHSNGRLNHYERERPRPACNPHVRAPRQRKEGETEWFWASCPCGWTYPKTYEYAEVVEAVQMHRPDGNHPQEV